MHVYIYYNKEISWYNFQEDLQVEMTAPVRVMLEAGQVKRYYASI